MKRSAHYLGQKYTRNTSNYPYALFKTTTKTAVKPRRQRRAAQRLRVHGTHTLPRSTRTSRPPTNPGFPLLLPPSPHLPAACGAHDQLRIPRHLGSPAPRGRPPAAQQPPGVGPPRSLRATPTEFREHSVRTNDNPNSVSSFCSATPPTTERPAGQSRAKRVLRKPRENEGGRWRAHDVLADAWLPW